MIQTANESAISQARPRVLVIGGRYVADSMDSHVVETLRAMGCPTEFVNSSVRIDRLGSIANGAILKAAHVFFREPERLSEPRILNAICRFVPDLILVIQGNQLSPKTVKKIRTVTAAPITCWCQDQLVSVGRQYMLGAGYDAVFVKDRYMQELFGKMIKSTSFHYLPEACNPSIHRPLELTADDYARFGCDVVLFGGLYYFRQEILNQLQEFDFRFYGISPGWMINLLGNRHMGGEVLLEKKVRVVRSARIALNTLHYAEINGLNCRTFELAGCGAFQLVTARPVLAEHFTPGLELDTFDSVDELKEKIRHYLRHPESAREIAIRGQKRAHAEHTYEIRLRRIFSVVLGIPEPAKISNTQVAA